ncbi:antitoxin component YwqK of YwqJK toxin-antitoxin module [Undibacterium sp. GrIS 1.8]|uniref:hypothetical protein n=1 Tax=Undibacterium sp. GrIS 1.8 TaxID=3143934 RepID=UPI0033930841
MKKTNKIYQHWTLGFLLSLSASFAHSGMTYTCDNSLDMDKEADRQKSDGTVSCVRDWGNEKQKERFVFSKGHKLEEEIDGPRQHVLRHFAQVNGYDTKSGEQITYFPGTSKIRIKENVKSNQNSGMKEEYSADGSIFQRTLYGDGTTGKLGYEVSSIGYLPGGQIRFARCSDKKETSIDAKLCGFNGPSDIVYYDIHGQVYKKVRLVQGKETNIEEAVKATSEWDSVLKVGSITVPKAAKRQKQINSDGSATITDLYADGKIKRVMHVDSKGALVGTDEEWFNSGGKARSTAYGVGGSSGKDLIVQQSSCWWENGSPRAVIQKKNDIYSMQYYWDNEKLQFTGNVSLQNDEMVWGSNNVESLMSCEPSDYGFKREGPQKFYSRNGGIEAEAFFAKGLRQGHEKVYEPKGMPGKEVLSIERDYEDDHVTHAKYYKEGKLDKEERYFSDGSVKEIRK